MVAQDLGGCRTSRLELHGATSYQLVNLLRLDRLARPRISPLRLWRLRLGLGGGLLFRPGAVLALEAGKQTSHVHAAAVVVARESGRRLIALSFVDHATGGTQVRGLRSRTTGERKNSNLDPRYNQIGLSNKRQCCHRSVVFGFGLEKDQARIGEADGKTVR